jgi:radical SAM superfamily enzyme YgiQ (UPF0313 family)
MFSRTPEDIKRFLLKNKVKLDHPQAYIGKECNTFGEHGEGEFHKDWDKAKLRILLTALWRYEDFRGNQTIPLLYYMMNSLDKDLLVERAHFPSSESEYKFFQAHNIPIFGLESKHEMKAFDIIMTSVAFVPPWINFILMLKMSGVPIRRTERDDSWPLIMAGGASCYGNFSLLYPVVDIIYMGDAETDKTGGLMDVLEDVKKNKPATKERKGLLLQHLQDKYEYLFIPSLFEPEYAKEKFVQWKTNVKRSLKVRKVMDLNLVDQYYKKPIPSYTDTTMGLGEVEISRGCRGACAFCGIGWKYRPYRERTKVFMLDALTENKKNGGAVSMCPIATEFAFYSEKRALIKEACETRSRFIDPLSMRIDAFAADEEFDLLLSHTGMNQLALGVEGPSQRLRNRLMKGVDEPTILKACEIAIKSGRFKRIKFFMISNIGETKEDFEEFFLLLDKVNAIKSKYNSKIKIKASWTPLIVEACVPLQWMRPSVDNRIDLYWWSGEVKKRGVEFGLGVKNNDDFLWTQQAFASADTRIAEAVIDASLKLNRPYISIIPPGYKAVLTEAMAKFGVDWSYIMRERDIKEPFLWDIVDRGVKREVLEKVWLGIKSGEQDKKETKFKIKTDSEVDIKNVNFYPEQKVVQEYLMEYSIPKEYDCVPNTYWKAYLHRAAYMSGFPISVNQMSFVSDRESRNWYYGKDYFKFGVQTLDADVNKFIKSAKEMKLGRFIPITKKHGMLGKFIGTYLVRTDFDGDELLRKKAAFEKAESVMVKVNTLRYFSGSYKEEFEAKDFYHSSAVYFTQDKGLILEVNILEGLGIRYFLTGFLGLPLSKVLKFDIEKTNLQIKTTVGGLLGVFPNED